jgi:hypothetical protein
MSMFQKSLLARIVSVGDQPAIVNRLGQLMGFPLGEGLGTSAQVLPLLFQVGESLEVLLLCPLRIFGLETELDFPLADNAAQVVGDASAKPINSSLGMLPGT